MRPKHAYAPPPKAPAIRFPVEPGDIPPEKAARRLHLTLAEFREQLPRLLARGFPPPDPTTGHFDLEAIDLWRRRRHPSLYPELAAAPPGLTAPVPVDDLEARRAGMVERFRASQKRDRHD